jgi:EAL and modified HD-GYP domain-containing signal transduction protein
MTNPAPAPLVFFHVLADQNGKPSALLFDVSAGDPAALADLVQMEAFDTITGAIPGLFRFGLDESLAAPMSAKGWNVVQPTDIYTTALLDKATVPPGVKWVGGDWCMAPPPKALGPQAASRALALQLVQKVANDADTHEIEALLRQDPTLSYHLLRLVNSLGMGASRKVTSFSQAILILGRAQLRRWLNLMLFAARQGDVRSNMLLARVAVRARALELLAKTAGLDRTQQEQAFMTGMFSLIGVLFGMPLSEVLAPLALSDTVQDALLRYEGDVGAMLSLLEAAEKGQFDGIAARLESLHIEPGQFNEAIVEANAWMLGTLKESQG